MRNLSHSPTPEDWRDLIAVYRVVLRARTGKRIIVRQPRTAAEIQRDRIAKWLGRLSGNRLIIAKVDGRCGELADSMIESVGL